MKTKLFLLTVAMMAAQVAFGAAQPRWEGDHPKSLLNITRDPLVAATSIQERERMASQLSPEGRDQLAADKRELASYLATTAQAK